MSLGPDDTIHTYIMGRCVSTAQRESSAMLAEGRRYWETIVWEWDAKWRTRGAMLIIAELRREIRELPRGGVEYETIARQAVLELLDEAEERMEQ